MAKYYKDQAYLEKVGKRLIEIRDSKKISQEKLQELSGIDTRQIGRIERAENNATISIIKKLTDSLKIKMSDLLDV